MIRGQAIYMNNTATDPTLGGWDSSFNTNYNYSGTNNTIATRKTTASGNQGVKATSNPLAVTNGSATGRVYYYAYFDDVVNDTSAMFGVGNASLASNTSLNVTNGWGVNHSGFIQHGFASLVGGPHVPAGNQGYTFAFAIDLGSGKIWFGKNNGIGTAISWWGDPVAGTGHAYTLPVDTYYPVGVSAGPSNTKVIKQVSGIV